MREPEPRECCATTTECHHLDDCAERPAAEFLGRFQDRGGSASSPESDHTRATVAEALAAWEAKGPTSLTAALLADALYGIREARRKTESTHADLVEAGWIDVPTLHANIEQAKAEARVDALSDLLTEIEDDPIRWQTGGGAGTGALVVTNIVKRRLSTGPREHSVTYEGDGFWRCSCTPDRLRPVGPDPGHRARADVRSSPGSASPQ